MAAAAAGPWSALPVWAMLGRAPLVAAGLVMAWRCWPRWRWVLVGLCGLGLSVDLLVPSEVDPGKAAARVEAAVRRVQTDLAAVAGAAELHGVLVPGGAEADPERPFVSLADASRRARIDCDAVVLVDERGTPVAWGGSRPRLPLRLRWLGGREIVAEPGLNELWVWWREPILDAGRTRGAVLAGAALEENGSRRLLGVWSGRAAVLEPRSRGVAEVRSPAGDRLFALGTRATPPDLWWSDATVVALTALALLATRRLAVPLAVVAVLPAVFLAGAWVPWQVPFAMVLGLLGWAVGTLPAGWPGRALGTLVTAGVAWGLGSAPVLPAAGATLLWPGIAVLAMLWALTALLRRAAPTASTVPWPLRLVGWAALAAALWLADPVLAGVGAGTVVACGFGRYARVLPALAAATVMSAGEAASARRTLVAETERTLERLAAVEAPAAALLSALPEAAVAELVTLDPNEQLVVLGRLAAWTRLEERLPGCALVINDASGRTQSAWGEAPVEGEEARVVARRDLRGGGQLTVSAPPAPHDVLTALARPPSGGPVAVFGLAGSAVGRGATFRPMSSSRVGRALADGRSWGRVRVGERELGAYLCARGDTVVAVPWVRPTRPETALALVAMAFWAALPVALWSSLQWTGRWWAERRTLTGRVRLLSVVITLLPLLLVANLLPRQWSRQAQRARLELARMVAEPLARTEWASAVRWVVRDLGGAVSVYEGGRFVSSSHPDQVVRGALPWLAPPDAYARAVRGWFEPVVQGTEVPRVFAPMPGSDVPVVVAVTGLRQLGAGTGFHPGEWFVFTGALGLVLALGAAERLGRRLARPLGELVAVVRRLERGERVETVAETADEEIALLSRALTTMARTVRGREEELRRERDRLGEVLATLSAAVTVVRVADGRVELANPAARSVLGDSDRLAVLEGSWGPTVTTLLAEAVAGRRVSETVRPPGDPDAVWRATAVPLLAESGEALLVMEDLSEVARAERLASLAELARIVAHEVKNPLTPIRLWAEEIQAAIERGEAAVAEVARIAAEQILDRVRHLQDVAQGFSNLVALERWEPAPFVLADTVAEVAREYAVLAQRGVRVVTRATGETSVRADRRWVARAIRHLIENSVRAVGAAGGLIEAEVVRLGNEVELTVRDSGGGVPEAHLGRLFEPHFSTTSDGTGLGLAVVERVASRSGGRVAARNVAGGLEVRIILPAAPLSG